MYGTDNVRRGFFERPQVEAILASLADVIAEIVRFVSGTGWRIGEVLGLRWEWVDRAAREIRLPDSKNGRPRTLALEGEVWDLIERRWAAREYQTPNGPALSA